MATSVDRYSPNAISGTLKKIGSYADIFNWHKIAAILLWFSSAYTTSLLIEDVRGSGNSTGGILDVFVTGVWGNSFFAAMTLQVILTAGESAIWKGQKLGLVASIALIIDTLVNAAAIWPYMQRFGHSHIWVFLAEWLHVNMEYTLFTAGILTLIGGIALAAAPEKYWSTS
jgi:hypothetical protein